MKNIKRILLTVVMAGVCAWSLSAATPKANWDKHCAKCHGKDGKGQTKMGKKLKLKDYTNPAVQAKLKDDEIFKAIKVGVKKGGKTKMKGYSSKLKDKDIKALVAYIRKMKK
jgi:cytochrome c553